jgi:fatty acid amide hydrolase
VEIYQLSAVQLRASLESGELCSEDIVRALHARTDAVDGSLGAMVHEFRDQAITKAREADQARARGETQGPLHGIPMTVKENLATVGTPQTMGIRSRVSRLAERNAAIVDAALQSGAIVLGKTNVPLLLLAMETHNDIFGTTVNPWNSSRVPGGSSGGEAAAIASGQSPLGLGTDIGGSIRIPCAWCGIPGLKPTSGFWSMRGSATAMPGQEIIRAQAGPMARCVDDLWLLMEALSPQRLHALDPRVPPIGFEREEIGLKGLRVGLCMDDGIFAPSASVQRAVKTAARLLEEAGAEIVLYEPPESWSLVETYFGAVSADGAATIRSMMEGQRFTPQLQLLAMMARAPSWLRSIMAATLGMKGQLRAQRLLRVFGDKPLTDAWALAAKRSLHQQKEMDAWTKQGIDFLLAPPTVTPAALLGETGDWSLGAWQTMRFNLLDLPAGVLPVGVVRPDEATGRVEPVDDLDAKAARFEEGSAGLPLSVQLVGRPWDDARLLALMGALETRLREQPDYPVTPINPA